MTFYERMDNLGSPTRWRGFSVRYAKNVELYPPGTTSRRRGFHPYAVTTTGGTLYDVAAWERYSGSDVIVDLVARVVEDGAGTLRRLPVYNGALVQSSRWQTFSTTAWTSGVAGGAFFSRNGYLYYSDGVYKRGFAGPSTPFRLGLDAPTGTTHIALDVNAAARAEPGLYDWAWAGYHVGRNVHSPLSGFDYSVVPASASQIQTYYSMGGFPALGGGSIRVTNSSVTFDDKETHRELYRRHPLTSTGHPARRLDDVRLVARLTSESSFLDRLNDTELGPRFTYCASTPRPWTAVAERATRYYYNDPSEPWKLWFSEPDSPENLAQELVASGQVVRPFLTTQSGEYGFTGEGWVRVPASAGKLLAPVTIEGATLLLCANETWMQTGNSPANFHTFCVSKTIGCVSGKAWASTPRGVLWLAPSGIAWLPPGGRPHEASADLLDFDAVSDIKLNRTLLHLACAAYDPATDTVEFAVPSASAQGNDLVVCINLTRSTLDSASCFYHAPGFAAPGEMITGMTTLAVPSYAPMVLYVTNKSRTYRRAAGTFYDLQGGTPIPVTWQLTGWWLRQRASPAQQTDLCIGLMPKCNYPAFVAASLWNCPTLTPPASGKAPDDHGTLVCTATRYGVLDAALSGYPYVYAVLRETASSPFEIHALSALSDENPDLGDEGTPSD